MGVYKIKDLENLTGIKAHTIRIWEKRYGILKPQRSETQIRNYDDDELVSLLNISLLNKHGLKISRIAEMSEKEIKDAIFQKESSNFEACFHENLLKALIELDENLFKQTIEQLSEEVGMEACFVKHLLPFLERIGIMWQLGTINPAQEHFISNLIRQKLIAEIDRCETNHQGKALILFLPEHESHEISLLFYDLFLKKAGHKTYYLGQSLPFDSLLASIEKIQPEALVTSWITQVDEDFCLSYFNQLHQATKTPVYAGGRLIKSHQEKLPITIHSIDSTEDLKSIAL